MVDQEAGHAGEFVRLDRHHLNDEFFGRQVGAGQLETVGEFGFVEVDDGLSRARLPGFELLDRLRCFVLGCSTVSVVLDGHHSLPNDGV